jgi:CheY-like chemotaxis protein
MPKPVNIGDAVRACFRLVQPMARDKARLELTVDTNLPQVPGTRRRLEQAFTNILVNAVHAAALREARQGVVSARVLRDGDDVLVEIVDNGPGIAPEVKERIFEPFFSTKAPDVGTGLGLPIAREAVEAHGGTIEVISDRGKGATFRIRLPSTPAVTPAKARQEKPRLERPKLLIVDDDELVARALERLLRNDYDVKVARSGEAALKAILNNVGAAFDALIVDIAMPEMNGPELYGHIAERWPGLERKIVFATGGAFTSASREFLSKVPNARFEKPISKEELFPILARMV